MHAFAHGSLETARLFPGLAPQGQGRTEPERLQRLGAGMLLAPEEEGERRRGGLPSALLGPLPAGYTYFGQFVTHDLTFSVSATGTVPVPGEPPRNARTPRLDLDSLYGGGPFVAPHLFATRNAPAARLKWFRGSGVASETSGVDDDLPRNDEGRALVPDPRNDENVLVSQLHLAFLKAHNRFVAALGDVREPFTEARHELLRHYHFVVVEDFLARVLGPRLHGEFKQALADLGAARRRGFVPGEGALPLEFSLAGMRFGHALARPSYSLNHSAIHPVPLFARSPLPVRGKHLLGFDRLPRHWTLDWSFFLGAGDDRNLQRALRLDPRLNSTFGELPLPVVPGGERRLPVRTLLAGLAAGLPAGQAVARQLGEEPLSIEVPDEEASCDDTPLWYYLLAEASQLAQGRHLGPVGGHLVSQAFLRALAWTPESYLWSEPSWRPAPSERGSFELLDLVAPGWPTAPPSSADPGELRVVHLAPQARPGSVRADSVLPRRPEA